MYEQEVIKILKNNLNFSNQSINKLKKFEIELIKANEKHNFISKRTERCIWFRHILDSAQLVKYINFNKNSLSDLGTGAGFPGIVLSIFNENTNFHVKLYEKSAVKRQFLAEIITKFELKAELFSNLYDEKIQSDYIVCRAFKKLERIIQVSREIAKKPHKLIVLKGQNAQEEVNKALKKEKYPYRLYQSMTNEKSKILVMNFI